MLAGDGPGTVALAREVGALAPSADLDPQIIVALLGPFVDTAATETITYSRARLRQVMRNVTAPQFAPALPQLTLPAEYALLWKATSSLTAVFAQLNATVPTRAFHRAYSPGFRGAGHLDGRGSDRRPPRPALRRESSSDDASQRPDPAVPAARGNPRRRRRVFAGRRSRVAGPYIGPAGHALECADPPWLLAAVAAESASMLSSAGLPRLIPRACGIRVRLRETAATVLASMTHQQALRRRLTASRAPVLQCQRTLRL